MKRTLYLKFLLGYLVFGILGFILISTMTNQGLRAQVEASEARTLYTECTEIATHYATNYYNGSMELNDLYSHLETISHYMNTQIKVIDVSGRIIIDSANFAALDNNTVIESFDIRDFGRDRKSTRLNSSHA